MRSDHFSEWAKRYCASTQRNLDEWLALNGDSWDEVFGADQITFEEINYALDVLLKSPKPVAIKDHLPALLRAVKSKRSEFLHSRMENRQERGTCNACGNTGHIVVPHPRCVDGGRWIPKNVVRQPVNGSQESIGVYYEATAYCRCYIGAHFREQHGTRRAMTIDEYEKFNPSWEDQFWARRQEEDRAVEAMQREFPHHLDERIQTIADTVKNRVQQFKPLEQQTIPF